MMSNDRNKAIDAAISSIQRQFGKGAIMRYGDSDTPKMERIPTGCIGLDIALGIGGVPRGRVRRGLAARRSAAGPAGAGVLDAPRLHRLPRHRRELRHTVLRAGLPEPLDSRHGTDPRGA